MLDIIPDTEQMTALAGKNLYEVWDKLCANIMIWIIYGIKVVKHGHMNINTVGAVKRCVPYMHGELCRIYDYLGKGWTLKI